MRAVAWLPNRGNAEIVLRASEAVLTPTLYRGRRQGPAKARADWGFPIRPPCAFSPVALRRPALRQYLQFIEGLHHGLHRRARARARLQQPRPNQVGLRAIAALCEAAPTQHAVFGSEATLGALHEPSHRGPRTYPGRAAFALPPRCLGVQAGRAAGAPIAETGDTPESPVTSRRGTAPVLLVSVFGPPVTLERVVVPLHGSARAEAAVRLLDDLAGAVVREVLLLWVIGVAEEVPKAERAISGGRCPTAAADAPDVYVTCGARRSRADDPRRGAAGSLGVHGDISTRGGMEIPAW